MTIIRALPSGAALRDRLKSSTINTIDINTTYAIDGVNGDTKNPTGVIKLGGQGLQLTAAGLPGRLQYSSHTVTRALHLVPWIPPAATSYQMAADPVWGTQPPWYIKNLTNNNPQPFWQIMGMPNGQTVDKFTIFMQGAAGHAAFPGGAPTMPTAKLGYFDTTTGGAMTVVTTATDTSATAAAFEAYHGFSAGPGLAHVIDVTHRVYVFQLAAETGAAYLAGDQFFHATMDVIVTDQSEW